MILDLSSLKKAVGSLARAIKVANKEIKGKVDTDREEVICAGVIQNFEFTYELCWKFMKRWLELNTGSRDLDGVTRRELFRRAVESQLINNIDKWMEFHEARNQTSHTYDTNKANEIFDIALKFATEARKLLSVLKKKND